MTSGVRTTTATVNGAVDRTERRARLSQPACHAQPRRREKNRTESIILYAAINLWRNLRSTYFTVEATDRHEASRGLSATAGLFVLLCYPPYVRMAANKFDFSLSGDGSVKLCMTVHISP